MTWLILLVFAIFVHVGIEWHRRRRIAAAAESDDHMNEVPRDGWRECSCGWCVHPDHHRECAACGKPVRL